VSLLFRLRDGSRPLRRVLVLGSHSDDIEIGCGATLLAMTRANPTLKVTWVVFAATDQRADEARAGAAQFLEAAESPEVVVHGFRDGFLPYVGGEVKDIFESLKADLDPDLVLTHARFDLHQDHRLVCELTIRLVHSLYFCGGFRFGLGFIHGFALVLCKSIGRDLWHCRRHLVDRDAMAVIGSWRLRCRPPAYEVGWNTNR